MGVKNSNNGNKKPFLYYYIIVLLVVMVLNALVFPSIMERSVEVPFSEFTAQLEAGKIKEAYVSSDNTEIVYSLKPENDSKLQWKRDPDKGLSSAELPYDMDLPDPNVCGYRPADGPDDGKANGRRKCHDLRQIQCQDLCGE